MPSRKTKMRRRDAKKALASMASEIWAIDEGYFSQLQSSVTEMAENGHAPEALTTSSYATSKLQVVGDTAIIPIVGVIRPRPDFFTKYYGGTACEDFRRDFESVIGNVQIKQIILVCDSPGGSVFQVEETAKLIFESRAIKQITAVTIGMNASACYYISSAAGRSIAGPSTLTGSVGVKVLHVDQSGYWKDMGIEFNEIQFGKHKTDGSQYRPLDKQGRESLQSIVDDYGNMFVDSVARHRNTTPEGVIENFGGGKVFVASEALSRNMIDGVGSIRLSQSTTPEQIVAESSVTVETSLASLEPVTPTGSNTAAIITEEKNVKRTKAMLFGLGMIASLEASDETATAALTAFCKARGESVPMLDGKVDEDKAIAMLNSPATATAAATIQTAGAEGTTTGTTVPAASAAAPAVQAARDQEVAEALAAAETRRDNIEANALLINQTSHGELVSREEINAAIKGGESADAIRDKWSAKIGAGTDGGSLVIGGQITPGQSSEDKFAEAASLSLLARSGVKLSSEQQSAHKQFNNETRFMSMMDMAKRSLSATRPGISFAGQSNHDIASAAILGGSPNRSSFGGGGINAAGNLGVNRPGDFANIMSNLAGLVLDQAMMLSRITYTQWTQRLPDAEDFRASTFLAIGAFTMLDDVKDGEKFEELQISEEYRNYVQVKRHGNTVKLTPVMLVNDASGLDSFTQGLQSLAYAHDNTVNEMFVRMISANPIMPDGTRLFDASRKNLIDVGAGGPPSKEQAEKMKLAHYAQTGIDTDMNIMTEPSLALVPSLMETPAKQTYAPFGMLPEMKEADVDAEINVHRGSLSDGVVRETNLDRYDTHAWYTLDMMLRVFGHQFMQGYGSGGRRNTWFNNNDECRHYSLTGIFGGAAFNPRGIVKNVGR